MFHAGVGAGIAYFVSTVLVMGILGNGLWGAGMRSVQEREANILRRFKVTPISPLPILVAAMVSGWLLFLPALFLLVGLAHFLYAMPMPQNWFSLFLMASLGVCSLRAIGLILAAVTNTMAEATIAIQSVYMPMLFLSGATVPAAMLPRWAQTLAQFMPASYLVSGFQGIFFRNQNLWDNAPAVAALLLTTVLGLFLAVQLFRWEKEEKIRPRNKLWVIAVLAPFVLMGSWQSLQQGTPGEQRRVISQFAAVRRLPDSQHADLRGRRQGDRERRRAGSRRQDRRGLRRHRAGLRAVEGRDCGRRGQDAAARPDRCPRPPGGVRRALHRRSGFQCR